MVTAGEVTPLFGHLWDKMTGELIEAKGRVTLEELRTPSDSSWTTGD